MSQRELKVESEVSSLRGVNERMEATLLDSSLVYSSKNVYFNLDGVASRIEGKQLFGVIEGTVVNLFQFGQHLLIQTLDNLQIIKVSDFIAGDFTDLPDAPSAPVLISKTSTAITLELPPAVDGGLTYDLLWSLNGTSFAGLQINVTPEDEVVTTGLTGDSAYYFKVRAYNADGYIDGDVLMVTTDEYSYLVSDTNPADRVVSDTGGDSLYAD